jgi:hypothetical protein
MRDQEFNSFLQEVSAGRQAIFDYVRGRTDYVPPNLLPDFIKNGAPRQAITELEALELEDKELIRRRQLLIDYVGRFEPKLTEVDVDQPPDDPYVNPAHRAAAQLLKAEEKEKLPEDLV